MSLARRIRRARNEHLRAVSPAAAALVFERDGDDLVVRLLSPTAGDLRGDHVRLAAACAEHARSILETADDEQTTTGAESAGGADHGEG